MAIALTLSDGTWTRAFPLARSYSPLLPIAIVVNVLPSARWLSQNAVQAWTSSSSMGSAGPMLMETKR